jgi:hypothetical protein
MSKFKLADPVLALLKEFNIPVTQAEGIGAGQALLNALLTWVHLICCVRRVLSKHPVRATG